MPYLPKTTALLVAGGKGLRMGATLPKQFLPLAGKPILHHTIHAFLGALPDIHLILVLPQEHIDYCNHWVREFWPDTRLSVIAGGATRFNSVQNGLKVIEDDSIVFIHDGVRPLINQELILRCYQQACLNGSAIPAIPITDSIRQWNGQSFQAIDRESLRTIQTPQTFKSELIIPAYRQEYQKHFTDDATVAEEMGVKLTFVEGLKQNIKITTPEDIIWAEAWLQSRPETQPLES